MTPKERLPFGLVPGLRHQRGIAHKADLLAVQRVVFRRIDNHYIVVLKRERSRCVRAEVQVAVPVLFRTRLIAVNFTNVSLPQPPNAAIASKASPAAILKFSLETRIGELLDWRGVGGDRNHLGHQTRVTRVVDADEIENISIPISQLQAWRDDGKGIANAIGAAVFTTVSVVTCTANC